MKLVEFAKAVGIEIEIYCPIGRASADREGRWLASIRKCEVKEGSILTSTYGKGKTPDSAYDNLVNELKGKTIVINAYNDTLRREYLLPEDLEY